MMTSANERTTRLTAAQAIVKYLQVQYSERGWHPATAGAGHVRHLRPRQTLREWDRRWKSTVRSCPTTSRATSSPWCIRRPVFARAKRRLATPGLHTPPSAPGATNMITGAARRPPSTVCPCSSFPRTSTPIGSRVPVRAATGAPSDPELVRRLRRETTSLHRPVSRFFRPPSPGRSRFSRLFRKPLRVLTDPAETGAVTLCLCQDVQPEAFDFPVRFFEEREWRIERRLPDAQRIREAVEMLRAARRPSHHRRRRRHLFRCFSSIGALLPALRPSRGGDSRRQGGPRPAVGPAGRGAGHHGEPVRDQAGRRRRPDPVCRNPPVRFRHRLPIGVFSIRTSAFINIKRPAAATPTSRAPCLSWPTPARRSRRSPRAAQGGRDRDRTVLSAGGGRDLPRLGGTCAGAEVDEHEGEVMLQTQLVRTLQEESRPGGHGHRRRRQPARGHPQILGRHRGAALPPGVRVLLHGL